MLRAEIRPDNHSRRSSSIPLIIIDSRLFKLSYPRKCQCAWRKHDDYHFRKSKFRGKTEMGKNEFWALYTHTHEDQKKTIFFFFPRIEINTHHFWYLKEWEIAQNVGVERFSQKDTNTNMHTNTHTDEKKRRVFHCEGVCPAHYNTTTTVGFAPVAHRSRGAPSPILFYQLYSTMKTKWFFFLQVIGNEHVMIGDSWTWRNKTSRVKPVRVRDEDYEAKKI